MITRITEGSIIRQDIKWVNQTRLQSGIGASASRLKKHDGKRNIFCAAGS